MKPCCLTVLTCFGHAYTDLPTTYFVFGRREPAITPRLIPSPEKVGAPRPPTDGTGLLRSALGPCRNGRAQASAVANGHERFGGAAGRRPSSSCGWDDADWRFELWSRRSRGVQQKKLQLDIETELRSMLPHISTVSGQVVMN
jgi:hypothetical protein